MTSYHVSNFLFCFNRQKDFELSMRGAGKLQSAQADTSFTRNLLEALVHVIRASRATVTNADVSRLTHPVPMNANAHNTSASLINLLCVYLGLYI